MAPGSAGQEFNPFIPSYSTFQHELTLRPVQTPYLLQPPFPQHLHSRGFRQRDRVRQARQHGRARQPDPQRALQSADDVLGLEALGPHEEGLDLVDLPLLGLRSGGVGLSMGTAMRQ